MRIIFAIEFDFRERKYSGIVRVMERETCTEYHVRVMNARLDRWLFGHHIFKWNGEDLAYDEAACTERVQHLRGVVQQALKAYLDNRAQVLATIVPGQRDRDAGYHSFSR